MPLRVVFFGTPAFAVPTLDGLVRASHDVVGVVTQPDRPRARGHRVIPQAVKARAAELQLTLFQPARLKDAAFLEALSDLRPDLAVVAAYGRLLPGRLLDLPRLGTINVHASLLPRWRGAAPVHRAILAGDLITGITIMRVVLALDSGPILARATTPIDPNETSLALEQRLAALGADLLVTTVARLSTGPVPEEAQDESRASYAARLDRRDSQIDWARPARTVHNQIRGLQPWPLAAAMLHGRRLIVRRTEVQDDRQLDAPPGAIVSVDRRSLGVATRPGSVRIVEVQPEIRPVMDVEAFLHGTRVAPGDRFEPVPNLGVS
jgi:methionyl-tRNA formyltransferase